MSSVGSSPRGRGKRSQTSGVAERNGLIPAWAGKTGSSIPRLTAAGAHPRVGGENRTRARDLLGAGGSSPRGRGKLGQVRGRQAHQRLIPAWAGKTLAACRNLVLAWAHPRVGGENVAYNKSETFRNGSSPRGRGKRYTDITGIQRAGLIPAWAGKTGSWAQTIEGNTAHPRVGGENRLGDPVDDLRLGSSPRGRGKLVVRARHCSRRRLIPAWAGKTPRPRDARKSCTAHPRVGGENSTAPDPVTGRPGSSPRGRGKQQCPKRRTRAHRLIPAWAGKTLSDLRFYQADRSDLGNP